MKTTKILFATAALLAGQAFATPLAGSSSTGMPSVPGATSTIDFEGQADSSFTSLTIGNVTFSGLGKVLRTKSDYVGEYNSRGAVHLDNDQGDTLSLRFDFANTVSAFAFNIGAVDAHWTLTAYNATGDVLESVAAPVTRGSNAGDYIGLANAGTSYALLTTGGYDWIFVDNFTIAEEAAGATVPEPASLALFGAGLVGAAASRRRKAKPAA
jgi:hypothetical protein